DGPAALVVVGEPGSGKTRLLREVRERTNVENVYSIVGYEPEQPVPLAAAAGLLRELGHGPEGGAHLRGAAVGTGRWACVAAADPSLRGGSFRACSSSARLAPRRRPAVGRRALAALSLSRSRRSRCAP